MKETLIEIVSPEKIRFSYTIAQTGARIGAYLIDMFIQIIFLLLGWLLFAALSTNFDQYEERSFSVAFFYLLYFFMQWGYFTLFELTKNGQTPGKKALKLKVIKASGESLSAPIIILRNLMRAIDGLPLLSFLGGLISIADKRSRRLGDLVADTLVVHELIFDLKEPTFSTKLRNKKNHSSYSEIPRTLSEEQLYIIRKFLNGRDLLGDRANQVAEQLSQKVAEKLKIKDPGTDPYLFLESVYKRHTDENKK